VIKIDEILSFYPLDCRPGSVEPLGSAGGLSGARFWRIVAPRGTRMLRCWPIEHPTPDGLRYIHAVLRHAADRGLGFLPVPIETIAGDSFVRSAGHLWELAAWLPGTADYERNPSAQKLRAAMGALARFHRAVADFAVSSPLGPARTTPAIERRLAKLRELQAGGSASLARAIDDHHWLELAPAAREFAAMLPRAVPLVLEDLAPLADVSLPLQVCLRDVWHDHVHFIGDVVTGLIDFGAVAVDTPATDVARLLGSLVGDDSKGWREGLAAYDSVRPLSADEHRAAFALDKAGTVLAGSNWIRWIYLEDGEFEDHVQVVERFTKLLARIRVLTR
jgi:Ser/Thr protein kinase RdoA (MazF antagonist)